MIRLFTTVSMLLIVSSLHAQQKPVAANNFKSDTTQAYFMLSGIPDKKQFDIVAIAGYEVWLRSGNPKIQDKLLQRLSNNKKPLPKTIIIWQTIR